jgi:hypothetical protein
MMMRHAEEPKVMIDFFEECKAQIESAFGESVNTLLSIAFAVTEPGKPVPPGEWRRQLRVADYTAEETEYINSVWDMAANTCQSIEATTALPAINDGESQDITEVCRELRSRSGQKAVNDSRGAVQLSAGTHGRVKQMARVRTTPVIDRGQPRNVSSDRGRSRGRGRKRGQDRVHGLIESSARLKVPLSPATGRMLLGLQVILNFRFLLEIMHFKLHFA